MQDHRAEPARTDDILPSTAGASPVTRPPPQQRPGDHFEDLFELAPEPYLLTDEQGTVKLANTRTAELFGHPAARIEGRPLADFIHAEDRAGLAHQLQRVIRGEGVHAWEVRLAAGSVEPSVLASVEPFETVDDGLELRWVLWDALPLQLVRDRLHRMLEDTQGDAAAMRALAEWQASLLGSVAQDMRTPLNVVAATIDSLLEDPAALSTPVAVSMLERASRQVMRLRRLLPTLLQIGRLQLEGPAPAREHVNLQGVVDEVLHDLEPAGREVTYQFEVDTVHADPLQLARVLVELLTHVTEHGPPGATLRIGALAAGVDAEVFLDVDGYRMDEEVRQVVFSPFLGTGRDGEEANGDDLGLSLVAVFARMHGGRAWVQDAPGGGCSFRVLLSNALPDTHAETDTDTDSGLDD